MKNLIRTVILTGLLIVSSGYEQAQSASLSKAIVVSATIPAATTLNIAVSSVNASGSPVFTPVPGNSFDFGVLTFNAQNGIYLPNKYMVVDVGASGGAGSPSVTIVYQEGQKPAGQNLGLGAHMTATMVKVATVNGAQTETVLAGHGKKRLIDLVGETITTTETAGAFSRTYVGVVTKDPNANPPDPANAAVFTNGDLAGLYSGTLTFTATVL